MSTPECPVCIEAYNEDVHCPRNLPCGHSACTACCTTLLSGEVSPECPLCKQNFRAVRVLDLPKNFGLISVISELCAPSRKKPAHARCEDHNEEYHIFDTECEKLVCIDCITTGVHHGHKCKKLSEVSESMRKGMNTIMAQWYIRAEELQKRVHVIRVEEDALRSSEQGSKFQIRNKFRQVNKRCEFIG